MDPRLTYATPPTRLVAEMWTAGVEEPVRRAMLATADTIDAAAASADAALAPAFRRYGGGVHVLFPEPLFLSLSGRARKELTQFAFRVAAAKARRRTVADAATDVRAPAAAHTLLV